MLRNATLLLIYSCALHVCSSMQISATPMQIFDSADRAIGIKVLVPLYQKMKVDPFRVDLDKLWQELDVGFELDAIVYDDAPLAHIRKAMLKS